MVAMTELQPCAMLAKGPPWTNAGLFSSVWTKLGLIAAATRAGGGWRTEGLPHKNAHALVHRRKTQAQAHAQAHAHHL